jgi:ABC-type xylose transport system substrate-binding protein
MKLVFFFAYEATCVCRRNEKTMQTDNEQAQVCLSRVRNSLDSGVKVVAKDRLIPKKSTFYF